MFAVNVVSTVWMRTYLHSAVNFPTDKSRFMSVLSGLNDELFNCVKVQREGFLNHISVQEMWFRKPEFEILLIVKQLFSEVMICEINVNIKQNIVIRLSQLHGQWANSNLFYYMFIFLQIFIFPLITVKLSQKEPLTSEARHSSLAQQVYLLFVFIFAVRTIIWTHCCAKYGLLFKDLRK